MAKMSKIPTHLILICMIGVILAVEFCIELISPQKEREWILGWGSRDDRRGFCFATWNAWIVVWKCWHISWTLNSFSSEFLFSLCTRPKKNQPLTHYLMVPCGYSLNSCLLYYYCKVIIGSTGFILFQMHDK